MISSDKCSGSCNVLSPKICFPKEAKDINVKAFNMIPNKSETKSMTKYISCDCKCKFNTTTWIQTKNVIIKHVNVNVKLILHAKKIVFGILGHVLVKIAII